MRAANRTLIKTRRTLIYCFTCCASLAFISMKRGRFWTKSEHLVFFFYQCQTHQWCDIIMQFMSSIKETLQICRFLWCNVTLDLFEVQFKLYSSLKKTLTPFSWWGQPDILVVSFWRRGKLYPLLLLQPGFDELCFYFTKCFFEHYFLCFSVFLKPSYRQVCITRDWKSD